MTFESFDAAALIETGGFVPAMMEASAPDAATLDAALREAARTEMRAEASILDLWVERPGLSNFRVLEGPAFGSGTSRLAWAPADDGTGVLDLSTAKSVPLFAAFGDDESEDEEVVVKGNRTKNTGTGDETGGGYGDGSYPGGPDGPGIGDGGSGDNQLGQRQEIEHKETCGSADGSAVQIADKIKATDDVYGPVEFSWQNAEYSTYVVRNGYRFGAYDEAIFTYGAPSFSGMPTPGAGDVVEGIVHNHPDILGGPEVDRASRYPSDHDWDQLEALYQQYGGVIPNYNPSLWIIDKDGVVREFSYSEKSQFYGDALSPDDRQAGVGLEGREKTTSCGSTS